MSAVKVMRLASGKRDAVEVFSVHLVCSCVGKIVAVQRTETARFRQKKIKDIRKKQENINT